MKVYVGVSEQQILNLLNFDQPSIAEYERMVEDHREAKGKLPRKKWRRLASAEVSRTLRLYVDRWLSTGVRSDGSESPSERELFRAFNAAHVVQEYLAKHKPYLMVLPGGSGPTLSIAEPELCSTEWTDFFLVQHEEAERLFTGLMLSDWNQRIGVCRYAPCGSYFISRRFKSSPYTHGTFCCREHQRSASATICVNESRTAFREALIEQAARQLLKWRINDPGWQKDRRKKTTLANSLCRTPRVLRKGTMLRTNWVTRHQEAIEQKRRELADGAGA